MAGGRPTDYNDELADRICDQVATRTCGLSTICDENEDFPHQATIYLWKVRHKQFYDKYLRAKQAQAELLAEECIDIAREKPIYNDENGNQKVDHGHVAWQKLNINTRQWHAGKLAPRVYGAKAEENDQNSQQSVLEKILNGEIEVKKKT